MTYQEIERPITLRALRLKTRELLVDHCYATDADPFRVAVTREEWDEMKLDLALCGLLSRDNYGPHGVALAKPRELARIERWAIDLKEEA